MDIRKGEDLCYFIGKVKKIIFDNLVMLKLGDNIDIRKYTRY